MNHWDKSPERRKYKRIKKNFILTYFNPLVPQEKFEASQLKNISVGGMCLITSKEFDPMTHLTIELKTPFLTDLVHLEGVVLESREKIKNIIYETRLEFSKISDQGRFVLTRLIEHYEKEEQREHL